MVAGGALLVAAMGLEGTVSKGLTTTAIAPEVIDWLGLTPLLVPGVERDRGLATCSLCGEPSADMTGGWVGPWAEAVWVDICETCRGDD